jgi:hypothetical protein
MMTWEWIAIALPWLFVLACPLAMFWMMRGMQHGGGSCSKKAGTENEGMQAAAVPVRSQEQEIQALKDRLARLEAEKRNAESWS